MTTHHSTLADFTASLSEIFADFSRTLIRKGEARQRKARVAEQIKALSEFDPHLLDDIGLAGFNHLTATEQEKLLLGQTRR
jgi:uncharacterized protein YjiS (DUF1127 family)